MAKIKITIISGLRKGEVYHGRKLPATIKRIAKNQKATFHFDTTTPGIFGNIVLPISSPDSGYRFSDYCRVDTDISKKSLKDQIDEDFYGE